MRKKIESEERQVNTSSLYDMLNIVLCIVDEESYILCLWDLQLIFCRPPSEPAAGQYRSVTVYFLLQWAGGDDRYTKYFSTHVNDKVLTIKSDLCYLSTSWNRFNTLIRPINNLLKYWNHHLRMFLFWWVVFFEFYLCYFSLFVAFEKRI